MGPKPPGGGDRTRGRPFLALEAIGRSRRAVMWLVVGGGVMMVDRAPTIWLKEGKPRQGRGQASHRATYETHRQPRCGGEEEGGKQTSKRTTRGNRTKKGAGAGPPHDHYHVPCACCSHVHAVHAGCRRRESRGRVGCGVWAGRRRRRERVLGMMIMMRRTTDEKAWPTKESSTKTRQTVGQAH